MASKTIKTINKDEQRGISLLKRKEMNQTKTKKLYAQPSVETWVLPKGLSILNSVSIEGNLIDWEDTEETGWGTFEPYQ